MSTAQELACRTVDVSLPVIQSAVDKGISAVAERIAELMGDLPEGCLDGFWADGTERANLIRIANLAILGLAGGAGPKECVTSSVHPDDVTIGAHLTGRYVATLSIDLGTTYQDLNGAYNGLGPVFARYAADRRIRLESASGTPRP